MDKVIIRHVLVNRLVDPDVPSEAMFIEIGLHP